MYWRARIPTTAGLKAFKRAGHLSRQAAEAEARHAEALLSLTSSPAARARIGNMLLTVRHGEPLPDVETVRARLGLGRAPEDAGETVAGFLDRWYATRAQRVKPLTAKGYEGHIRVHIRPAIGDVLLEDLTVDQVQDMLNAVPGEPHRVFATIRTALNAAVKQRKIRWNPCAGVELPPETPARGKTWTPAQARQFFDRDEVRADELYLAFRIALFSTTRRGELAGLHWTGFREVEGGGGVFAVDQEYTDIADRLARWQRPKSRAGLREIHVGPEVVRLLKAHRRVQAAARLAAPVWWQPGPDEVPSWVQTDLVFCHLTAKPSGRGWQAGEPFHPSTFTHRFHELSDRAGLPGIRLHDTRRTSISAMANAGVDRDVRKKMAGHADDAVHDLYTDFWDETLQDAARRTEAFILGAADQDHGR